MKKLGTINKRSIFSEIKFTVILFFIIMFLMIRGAVHLEHISTMQKLDLVRQSVRRAAIQCYAIEGSYPSDVTYLEQNYGVTIDHNKFYVDYMSLASNIMPNIEVYEKY